MPNIHETAYPRLKVSISKKDLDDLYTPKTNEIALASCHPCTRWQSESLLSHSAQDVPAVRLFRAHCRGAPLEPLSQGPDRVNSRAMLMLSPSYDGNY